MVKAGCHAADLRPSDVRAVYDAMLKAGDANKLAENAMPPEDPTVWLITYAEAGIPHELFSGCGATDAAHRRFEQIRVGYNCHLFVRAARA